MIHDNDNRKKRKEKYKEKKKEEEIKASHRKLTTKSRLTVPNGIYHPRPKLSPGGKRAKKGASELIQDVQSRQRCFIRK